MVEELEDVKKLLETQYRDFIIPNADIKNMDLYSIVQSIYPEYRLFLFSKFCHLLNNADYNMGLKYSYAKTEGINSKDAKLSIDEVLNLFSKIDKKLFMEEDYDEWIKLPDIITIYRGTTKDKSKNVISWTLEEKRAIWFYQRYNSKGTVYKAKIKKDDAICLLDKTACGEKEIIVNYKGLFDIEEISKNRLNREKKIEYNEENMYADDDFVIEESKIILQRLTLFGIYPERALIEEVYRVLKEKGRYKSNYKIKIGQNEDILLDDLIKNTYR